MASTQISWEHLIKSWPFGPLWDDCLFWCVSVLSGVAQSSYCSAFLFLLLVSVLPTQFEFLMFSDDLNLRNVRNRFHADYRAVYNSLYLSVLQSRRELIWGFIGSSYLLTKLQFSIFRITNGEIYFALFPIPRAMVIFASKKR